MKKFLLLLILLFGCASHVPLTKSLIREYNLTANDLSNLQLYISDGILLEQKNAKINKNVDDQNYSLKKTEDYFQKQIYFKKDIPCIVTSSSPDKILVTFEPCDNLMFVANKCKDPSFDYQPDNKIVKKDTLNFLSGKFKNWKLIGEEIYCDSTFNALIENENYYPYLLVDKASLTNFILEFRSVKGIKQTEKK